MSLPACAIVRVCPCEARTVAQLLMHPASTSLRESWGGWLRLMQFRQVRRCHRWQTTPYAVKVSDLPDTNDLVRTGA